MALAPPRQRDQLALGREAEHLVVEQLELGVLEELLRIGALRQQLDGAAQPRIGAGFARQHLGRRAGVVLVERVRGDAVFGDLVHLPGADLQLDALLARTDHGGVDRAVVVLLGGRDVVLEAARHHRPGGVHDAERLVALGERSPRSRGSRRCRRAARSRPTCAPSCARSNRRACAGPTPRPAMPRSASFLVSCCSISVTRPTFLRLQRVEALGDHLIGFRIELAERQVLELLAHLVHAHAAGERRIDVERLLGDAPARLRRHVRERAHVVQAVGELDQQHPHVVGDRQQELAQVLRLLGLLGDQVELLELGQALDQRADVRCRTAGRSRRGWPRCPRWCRAAARRRWWRRRA